MVSEGDMSGLEPLFHVCVSLCRLHTILIFPKNFPASITSALLSPLKFLSKVVRLYPPGQWVGMVLYRQFRP